MSSNCLLLWTAAKISSLSISDYIFHRVLLLSTLSLPPYWSSSWLLSTLSSTVLRVDKPAPVIFIWVFIAFGSMLATCTLSSVLSLPSYFFKSSFSDPCTFLEYLTEPTTSFHCSFFFFQDGLHWNLPFALQLQVYSGWSLWISLWPPFPY